MIVICQKCDTPRTKGQRCRPCFNEYLAAYRQTPEGKKKFVAATKKYLKSVKGRIMLQKKVKKRNAEMRGNTRTRQSRNISQGMKSAAINALAVKMLKCFDVGTHGQTILYADKQPELIDTIWEMAALLKYKEYTSSRSRKVLRVKILELLTREVAPRVDQK